ncbi:MAG: CpaF family protein [Burkholderiaceae bacterium]|jgi:pilus assembly protein CpaF
MNAREHLDPIRAQLHREIVARADLAALQSLPPERLQSELARMTEALLDERRIALNQSERREIAAQIRHEMLGLGPLEPLLADPQVSDVLVNGPAMVYVERAGRLQATEARFDDAAHLMRVINRIVSQVGRRIDESSPMVDARLPDGSRVNAIIAPLAVDGPVLSIRRFARTPIGLDRLVELQSLTRGMATLLSGLVRARLNLLISGGTGSGKTTLLNVLSSAIPHDERIVTIEDSAELQLQQPHVIRLETRPPNIEGQGEVSERALLRNSLRMRPDRIIVGEVRGAEVLDMLQAMNTGHDGSMTTIHANSPRDAITRMEHMLGMSGMEAGPPMLRQQIGAAISVIVQVARLADGQRRVVSVQELAGMEGDTVTMQEIFRFEQTGLGPDGAVTGRFRATGIRPRFTERLRRRGIALADTLFDPAAVDT